MISGQHRTKKEQLITELSNLFEDISNENTPGRKIPRGARLWETANWTIKITERHVYINYKQFMGFIDYDRKKQLLRVTHWDDKHSPVLEKDLSIDKMRMADFTFYEAHFAHLGNLTKQINWFMKNPPLYSLVPKLKGGRIKVWTGIYPHFGQYQSEGNQFKTFTKEELGFIHFKNIYE
jgi:hypothetical protein